LLEKEKVSTSLMENNLDSICLFGLGCPVLDIKVANVPKDFLDKNGLSVKSFTTVDKEKFDSIWNAILSRQNEFHIEYFAGGSTQNVLRVAQWLLPVHCKTCFMGSVGKDNFADILKKKSDRRWSSS